jgi:hypothetical protein
VGKNIDFRFLSSLYNPSYVKNYLPSPLGGEGQGEGSLILSPPPSPSPLKGEECAYFLKEFVFILLLQAGNVNGELGNKKLTSYYGLV